MIANRPTRSRRRRAGFGLVEMALAGAMIAIAMTATVRVVGWVALERQAVGRRERAVVEASNLLERLAARPWDEQSDDLAGRLRISEATARLLHSPTLEVKIARFDDAPPRKRLTVEIRWPDRSGRPESPVRLVAWTHRRGEAGR